MEHEVRVAEQALGADHRLHAQHRLLEGLHASPLVSRSETKTIAENCSPTAAASIFGA